MIQKIFKNLKKRLLSIFKKIKNQNSNKFIMKGKYGGEYAW